MNLSQTQLHLTLNNLNDIDRPSNCCKLSTQTTEYSLFSVLHGNSKKLFRGALQFGERLMLQSKRANFIVQNHAHDLSCAKVQFLTVFPLGLCSEYGFCCACTYTLALPALQIKRQILGLERSDIIDKL